MQLVRTADPTEYRRDGRTVRIQGFNAHPVVHACMRVIADIVASVPLVVLKEKGDYESRVPESHPLQQLLNYPGPRLTARQFRARFAVDFLGYGNAFFVMERNGERGPIRGLRPVNPESVQQVWIDTEGDPRRYDYANWAGIIVNVPTEDMLHFRDLEMGRPFEADVFGYPRGATAIGSLLADNEATQYVRQVVTNDGTPTFAVLMQDEVSTEDAVAMQDRYTERVVNRGKRGVPAFFGGVRDIKPLGFTLSDLEFPDLRRVSREDICAAFGVDPRMVGIASASSDGGLSGVQYSEARARLVQHTIEPLLSAFEDELNHWLAPEFGEVWVAYDHDVMRDLVENDNETSTRVRAEFQSSLRTWEESRKALKLSPLPEPTDTILKPVGAELVPAAVAVIDPRDVLDQAPATDNEAPQLAPTQAQIDAMEIDEPETEIVPEDEDDRAEPVVEVRAEPVVEPVVERIQVRTPEEKRAYWDRAMQELDRTEQTYKATATAQFRREQKRVTAAIRESATPTDAIVRVRQMYRTTGEFADDWQTSFAPLIGKTYQSGARQVAGVGASIPAVLNDPQVRQDEFDELVDLLSAKELKAAALRAIAGRAERLAEYVGDTTAKEVTAAIRAGERAGLSVNEISRLVGRAIYGEDRIDARTTMIARTEAAGAMSQGSWDQAQAEGDLFRSKTWLSFTDKETREAHLAQNDMTIGMNESFPNGLAYPLDPSGDAGEVINCRCVLAYSDEPV
jgi:HK97 family phage portal protein